MIKVTGIDGRKKGMDILLRELKEEKASCHELTTKMLNYEYLTSKVLMLKTALGDMSMDDYIELAEYRKAEFNELEKWFNVNVVNPIYAIVREQIGSRTTAPEKYVKAE